MPLQLDTVFIWVSDLSHSLPWYETVGFDVGPRHGAWQSMVVDGDTRFALHEGKRPPGTSTAVPSFRVEDLESHLERLRKAGIHPIDEVTDTGAARFVTLTDPDRNEIQLLER